MNTHQGDTERLPSSPTRTWECGAAGAEAIRLWPPPPFHATFRMPPCSRERRLSDLKKEKGKSADKPGSVKRLWGRRAVIHLGAALPWRSSSLPGSGASHAMASLFGLAPDGVCRAGPVASPAVGSYPTISPLP